MLGITTSEVKLVQFEKKLLKSLIPLTFKLLQVVKLVQPVNLTTWFFIVTLLAVVKPGGIQLVALVIPLPKVIPLISVIPVHPLYISLISVIVSTIVVIGFIVIFAQPLNALAREVVALNVQLFILARLMQPLNKSLKSPPLIFTPLRVFNVVQLVSFT